jgi:hypothetical protein
MTRLPSIMDYVVGMKRSLSEPTSLLHSHRTGNRYFLLNKKEDLEQGILNEDIFRYKKKMKSYRNIEIMS